MNRDLLLDVVQHTFNLGFISMLKITGSPEEVRIDAMAEDRSVVVQAQAKNSIPEFTGTFGLPNLATLNVILNIPEYKEDAKISVTLQERNGVNQPVGMHFENKAGDFMNDYRFMSAEIADNKISTVKFRGAKWDVEFTPLPTSILRMKYQSQANSEEKVFIAKTDKNKNLKFHFGDHSSHAGDFVFQADVNGKLTREWNWPVKQIMSILDLPGDKVMKISDEGAIEIAVDSAFFDYKFFLPAQVK